MSEIVRIVQHPGRRSPDRNAFRISQPAWDWQAPVALPGGLPANYTSRNRPDRPGAPASSVGGGRMSTVDDAPDTVLACEPVSPQVAPAAPDSRAPKPATAARIYDYLLGGLHNFPADQEAARAVIALLPSVPVVARAHRAFLGRAVRHLAEAGVRQFLDVGSGIPTEGNVHEIAQSVAPESRVVYVDIDPVAVGESLQLLDTNHHATALRGDLRTPQAILEHRAVARLLDFNQPIGLLLAAVLHFVPDDQQAYDAVAHLLAAAAPGSYLVVSHAAAETFQPDAEGSKAASEIYRQQTATPGKPRTRGAVQKFLTGLHLVDPGTVWVHQWHSDPTQPPPALLTDDPQRAGGWAAVGKKP